jgi:Gpi18-like mannosyltransferase
MKSQRFNKTTESSKEADRLPIPSRDDLSNNGRPGGRATGLGDRQDGGPAWARAERDRGPEDGGSSSRKFLWMYVGLAGSLLLRLSLFDFESGDYRMFLSQWYDFFRDHGRWQGLARAPDELRSYCYPAVYMYLISLSTLLPLPKLYAIKLISIVADYVGAWFVFKIVRGPLTPSLCPSNGEKVSSTRERLSSALPIAAALAFLFLPTVVMNGALWGQCDILYATGLLASLFYVLERRPVAALVAFGIAFSLKPQAIFLGPLVAGLFVTGRLPWKHFWIPAAVHVGCAAPAMLAGLPVRDALGLWISAAVNPTALTLGAPNWYQWIFEAEPGIFFWPGVVLTVVGTAMFGLLMRERPTGGLSERQWLVSLALLSVLFPPFFLPGVHERYFFAADVLSVVYAFYVPSRWMVAALVQFASGFAYLPYLFGKEPLPGWLLALVMTTAIGVVVFDLAKGLFAPAEHPQPGKGTA